MGTANESEFDEKRRILVVEDDAILRRLVSHVLEQSGFHALLACDGEDALAQVRSRRPDAVILDAMMPGMDGLEVLRLLRGSPATRDIPVMMLSARGLERDVVNGFDFGANDYLVKPFRSEELLQRLKRLLAPARTWDREEGR